MNYLKLIPTVLLMVLVSCQSAEKETAASEPFCKDTACLSETLRYDSPAPGKPFVTISFKNCKIDNIHWEKGGKGVIKDILFSEYIPNDVKPSKEALSCTIVDGKYAWIRFNDCATGRGYVIRLPFDSDGTTSKFTSALNNFDPKFKISDDLVAYYDNTFIYVQDTKTGDIAQQLLTDTGVKSINYNDVHSLIEEVNITKDSIYAKLKVDNKIIEHHKPLTFEKQ